jgi:hypothetical protein
MDKDNLKSQIEIEIENLERLIKENKAITNRFTENPGFIETRAAGSVLHDFYCGVEKIFKRIAIFINNELPGGEDWHMELLLQMSRPANKKFPRVISQVLLEKLKECLRFRHLFRNIYGFELNWERFKNLSLSLEDLLCELKDSLNRFIDNLNDDMK